MVLGRKADPGLVAEQFLGHRVAAQVDQLARAADIGQMVDRRIEADERVARKLGVEAQGLAGDEAVEALGRLRGIAQQRRDRTRAAGGLFGARRPIISAGAKLALAGQLRGLLEGPAGAGEIAHPPRGEARGPGGLPGPVAGRALAPGVGDAAGVEVETADVIDEGDALAGLGAALGGQGGREGQQLRLGGGGIVGLDQLVEDQRAADRRRDRPGRRRAR